jgi:carboxyl-terminal processing protease
VVLLVGACQADHSASTTTTPATSPSRALAPTLPTRLTAAERSEIFDAIWQTVNDGYFDPTFGGTDWRAIGERYRGRLAAVQDDDTFWFGVVNPMLFEVGVSHLLALPSELLEQLEPRSFATGTLGMDVRLLDNEVVVTQVTDGYPADQAGLRPGFVITSIDGRAVADITARALPIPPDNEPNRRVNQMQTIFGLLYGETGEKVIVEYLDGRDRPGRAVLAFAPRRTVACGEFLPGRPPACSEVEVRRLAGGAGYLRFSAFLPEVLGEVVVQAIRDMDDAPALVIDLRGNPGGLAPVRRAIGSALEGSAVLFERCEGRGGVDKVYLDPVADAYQGRVVIVVDELSRSASEYFAGSLQSLGRASIVGSPTPGSCLVAAVVPLPHDGVLLYPRCQAQTPEGRVLERNGVIPDVPVALDRQELLDGIDAQLEAAIEQAS